jgi:3-methyladenine DNA glycosylase AlkD
MSGKTEAIRKKLRELGDPVRAEKLASFFRTETGGYGEGDRFLSVRVPLIRALVREYRGMPPVDCAVLLRSQWHEERLFALLMMVDSFNRGGEALREEIFGLYMSSTAFVNNWDLVDASAPHLAGAWLLNRDRSPLYALARSEDLWERRIAIVATQYFIRRGDYADTLRIGEMLLHDSHDLIHKAVGWMLREVGDRELPAEEAFLLEHCRTMPRTMLRYAIEKFPEETRQAWLKGGR